MCQEFVIRSLYVQHSRFVVSFNQPLDVIYDAHMIFRWRWDKFFRFWVSFYTKQNVFRCYYARAKWYVQNRLTNDFVWTKRKNHKYLVANQILNKNIFSGQITNKWFCVTVVEQYIKMQVAIIFSLPVYFLCFCFLLWTFRFTDLRFSQFKFNDRFV